MRVKEEAIPHKSEETKPAPRPYGWGLAVCSFLGGTAGYLLYRQNIFTADGAIAEGLMAMVKEQQWLQIFGSCYFVLLIQAGLLLTVSLCCLGGFLFPILFGLYGGTLLYLALDAVCQGEALYWVMLWLPAGLAYTALTVFSAGGFSEALALWQNLFHPGKEKFSYKNTFIRFFYTLFALALSAGCMTALGYLFFCVL